MNLLQKEIPTKQSKSVQGVPALHNSGFGGSGNQLLAAASADYADDSGVRCANTYNRGAYTYADYGFPLLRLCGFPLCCALTAIRNYIETKLPRPCLTKAATGMAQPRMLYADTCCTLAKE